jgi:hypothetical protein
MPSAFADIETCVARPDRTTQRAGMVTTSA